MTILQTLTLGCEDDNPKTYTVLCDGGVKHGQYRLILCDSCYDVEERKFVISEEILKI